ncbi:hypothetical protein M758_2G229100 [Ceratodon purpureus]|uniref:Uncharacterized protein n=1 Tax=Ceratodon purpureus TaxID=3225 RepID=A0A8T0J175_CERPU|nr:hypothetical protein KC19_2G275300 [Ceratodon purpureus]KAG0627802.1 hypothetical protein M758_2G229100 [Ceratodon purpureus]
MCTRKSGLRFVTVFLPRTAFLSIPDQNYESCRRTSRFITKYNIFPDGYLPAVSTITAAMASSSSLCAEHKDFLGFHYCETLLRRQDNFH